jgi:hypothetical protein
VPLEDREIDTLDNEELRELVRRQRVHLSPFQDLTPANITQERDAASRALKQKAGVKRERTNNTSTHPEETDDEPSVVSTKRPRKDYRTTRTASGVEEIDLT